MTRTERRRRQQRRRRAVMQRGACLALDKLGGHIERYYATEIDKYAIQTTQHNYPETVQLGDAFQVRDEEWSL